MSLPPYQTPNTPEINQTCPAPPYNTLNFTSASPAIFSTLTSYARTQPQYPLPSGSAPDQLRALQQNVTYYSAINQQTIERKQLNQTLGTAGQVPYPQFKSEGERLMYRQGLAMTVARNVITGQNPSAPAGVPASTLYQIVYS
jgi:streptogramin lyase